MKQVLIKNVLRVLDIFFTILAIKAKETSISKSGFTSTHGCKYSGKRANAGITNFLMNNDIYFLKYIFL